MPWTQRWSDDFSPAELRDSRKLASLFPHPRDELIAFRERDHKYFVNEGSSWIELRLSVSGFYQKFFPGEADADWDEIALRFVKRQRALGKSGSTRLVEALARSPEVAEPFRSSFETRDDIDAKTAALVREAWRMLGTVASERGTRCHLALELYANDEPYSPPPVEAPFVRKAVEWVASRRLEGWLPYRTEWSIFIDGASAAAEKDRALSATRDELLVGPPEFTSHANAFCSPPPLRPSIAPAGPTPGPDRPTWCCGTWAAALFGWSTTSSAANRSWGWRLALAARIRSNAFRTTVTGITCANKACTRTYCGVVTTSWCPDLLYCTSQRTSSRMRRKRSC